jgi:HSP20 family protein
MSVVHWDPFREMGELQRSINQLFEGRASGGASTGFPVDVYETAGDVVVRADLPGVRPDSIQVQHHDGSLYIRASRTAEAPEDASWLVHQTVEGDLFRALTLGVPVNLDAVNATYDAGVLEVRLPKAEHARPRQIPVRTGPSSAGTRRQARGERDVTNVDGETQ